MSVSSPRLDLHALFQDERHFTPTIQLWKHKPFNGKSASPAETPGRSHAFQAAAEIWVISSDVGIYSEAGRTAWAGGAWLTLLGLGRSAPAQ